MHLWTESAPCRPNYAVVYVRHQKTTSYIYAYICLREEHVEKWTYIYAQWTMDNGQWTTRKAQFWYAVRQCISLLYISSRASQAEERKFKVTFLPALFLFLIVLLLLYNTLCVVCVIVIVCQSFVLCSSLLYIPLRMLRNNATNTCTHTSSNTCKSFPNTTVC